MALLFYWRPDVYAQDNLQANSIRTLHQRSRRMHSTVIGDEVWLITRNAKGEYVLAGQTTVEDQFLSPESRYGQYAIRTSGRRTQLFRIESAPSVVPILRKLKITLNAKNVGHAFQGASAVRLIDEEDATHLRIFARRLKPLETPSKVGRPTAEPTTDKQPNAGEARNAAWTRSELILALSLYFDSKGQVVGKQSKSVVELSELLGRLADANHVTKASRKFRNPNGVYMKLMNFRSFDPEFYRQGKKGLTRTGAMDRAIWEEFSDDPPRLREMAAAIRANLLLPHVHADALPPDDDDSEGALEGDLLTRQHRYRERNRKIIAKKKKAVLGKFGALKCEVCSFDFSLAYGARGIGFIECHHIEPVHKLDGKKPTKLSDLALVCANCHRMIHTRRPWSKIGELREVVAKAGNKAASRVKE